VIETNYDMDTVELGASIACSGACLTVVDKGEDWFAVDLSGETVSKTASDHWREGARLNLERAQAASQTLAALGLAAIVLDDGRRVIAANSLIEGLTNYVHWRAADAVTLSDKSADDMLTEALARIVLKDDGGVRSFPVRDPVTGMLMVGHVVPIRFSARDIFARSTAVFILMPVAAPASPPVELVMSLFDLTPAEARIARGLAVGKTVEDLAGDNAVSPNTVRVQVRAVLEKTGCQRQTDVVAMLGGLSAVRGEPPQRG